MEPSSTNYPNGVVPQAAPGVVVCVPARPEPEMCEQFPRRLSLGLGIALVIAGCLCVGFNVVSVVYAAVYAGVLSIGHGIWGGILFAVTGGAGIEASRRKTKWNIVGYLVLCIISAIVAAVVTAISIVGAKFAGDYHTLFCVLRDNQMKPACHILTVAIAMESCVAISAYTALCLSIWGAVNGLKAVTGCCSKPSQQQGHMLYPANQNVCSADLGAVAYNPRPPCLSPVDPEKISIKTNANDG